MWWLLLPPPPSRGHLVPAAQMSVWGAGEWWVQLYCLEGLAFVPGPPAHCFWARVFRRWTRPGSPRAGLCGP